ncbi:MAG: glutamine-hydrolyzing carbamoyl-phosphate synthase small subunit [Desulfomonilia bacterium]|jgi:carbamoyl-phosphate synthase small subunit|nr:glutamine-hydrolyzing carbamoyl-phosphate synthase small subunit [Pseudomonadota bacterium]HON39093.1 glutamine-hydrolyzing carbamoyl-phosphate synthase small subunit [Deltaproteobacteria bacterium]HPD22178.1 glutamine-hydrolyzing carbamoyl-phosphate synthase small subunit [Deltaproteobacteria bacterium]HRS56977.1 glutamine-hydrolyzing carbamoyl-phosphate synthase small subunit [Desulfomonilia bacterium]HRV36387.1 glutamine-hydrolyzing carbamoyl-phosphate synthase small subunit [Desulfomonil
MTSHGKRPAVVVLEDGSVFRGRAFAGDGDACGEVVFNTAMTGYQEVLTDPSYREQILVMTYPLMGSYGINDQDRESPAIHLQGFVVREYQSRPSNWRSTRTLQSYLEEFGRIGIEGVDTRALTRRIRTAGAMRGIISTRADKVPELLERVRAYPGLAGRDIVSSVTCSRPLLWKSGELAPLEGPMHKGANLRVVVLDCGVKHNILRSLERMGCQVVLVPSRSSAEDILTLRPDGVMLSNGPGDPAPLAAEIETVRGLLGRVPIFGICLGHQILSLAFGARTEKLKFGHHGVNQPVKNLLTGRVEITSQNHGFSVVTDTLPKEAEITHINLNDQTLEGVRYPAHRAFSVQYHPEASPGPHDSHYLFNEFLELMGSKTGMAAGMRHIS